MQLAHLLSSPLALSPMRSERAHSYSTHAFSTVAEGSALFVKSRLQAGREYRTVLQVQCLQLGARVFVKGKVYFRTANLFRVLRDGSAASCKAVKCAHVSPRLHFEALAKVFL